MPVEGQEQVFLLLRIWTLRGNAKNEAAEFWLSGVKIAKGG